MCDEITLRPATLNDAQRLAQLWTTTFPDKFGPILGDKAERVLCDWLRLSERHLQTTTLAEIDETVTGFMVLETSPAPHADDGRWMWHALQLNNGIFGALRGMLLMLLIDRHHPRHSHEIYIEMLGVDPAWRGRGVAHQLIAHAEAVAQQQNFERLALAVVNDNLPAIQLYEKMGFTTQSEQRSRLLQWITGHSGYYAMVKEIVNSEW